MLVPRRLVSGRQLAALAPSTLLLRAAGQRSRASERERATGVALQHIDACALERLQLAWDEQPAQGVASPRTRGTAMALTTMMDPNGVFMEIAFARVQSVLSSHRRACRAPHAQG